MENQLENSPFCRNVLIVTIFSSAFSLGYAFTCLNPLVPVINELYNETYYRRYAEPLPSSAWTLLLSLTMSIIVAGGFCGAVTVRFVLKALSRRGTMILTHLLQITGAVVTAVGGGVFGSYEVFIIGRFLLGYAIGLGMNTVPVVIAEMSTHHKQGLYQSVIGVCIIAGNIFGPTLAHPKLLGNSQLWPCVISVSCLPSILYLCCVYWIPNTPYMMLRTANRGQAIDIVKRLRTGSEVMILDEIQTMESEQSGCRRVSTEEVDDSECTENKEPYVNFIGVLKRSQYRKQFFTVVMLYVGAMASGVNHVVFFSDQIFVSAGIAPDNVTYATIGAFAAQGVVSFIGMKLLGTYGSRRLLLGSEIIIIVSQVLTTISLATRHLSSAAGYLSIIGILLTLNGYAVGPNLVIHAIAGEVTIEPTRPTIMNYGGGCLWFAAWLSGFIPPYLDSLMAPYSLLVWAVLSLVFCILFYFFIPETKGKSSAEIQEFFQKSR